MASGSPRTTRSRNGRGPGGVRESDHRGVIGGAVYERVAVVADQACDQVRPERQEITRANSNQSTVSRDIADALAFISEPSSY